MGKCPKRFGITVPGDIQNSTGQGPEQPDLISCASSRGLD